MKRASRTGARRLRLVVFLVAGLPPGLAFGLTLGLCRRGPEGAAPVGTFAPPRLGEPSLRGGLPVRRRAAPSFRG
ncbi:hypothetical protein AN946_04620 [Trueperella pyogenes]|nr:hypothetical protein AN946_04620 [Trueperella pyogenes]